MGPCGILLSVAFWWCNVAVVSADWVSHGPEGGNIRALQIDPTRPGTLYVGTVADDFSGGVFKSTNGGGSWTAMNAGLTNPLVNAFAIDPTSPGTLYAGTGGGGVFKSTNGGGSWTAMNAGLTSPLVNALARISHQANRTRSTTGPANDNEGFSVRRGAAGAPSDTLRPAAESDRRRWDTPRPSGASAVHAGGLRRTVAPQQRSGYARWRFASACAKSRWRGKTLLSAMTTRRTLTVTSAPSFSSRVRIVLT